MSNEITVAFVQQFSNNIILLAQQKGSRLRDKVTVQQVTGNAAYFERMGAVEAVLYTSRHSPSPILDTPHSRRMVVTASWIWGEMIDNQDKVRMLIDPQSAYVQQAVHSLGRRCDREIIAAATGNSVSVSSSLPNGDNRTNVALPSTQSVGEDVGTANSDLNIEKILAAHKILERNDIDMDEELTLVLNSSAKHALLALEKATSSDYMIRKNLLTGDIDEIAGFKIVRTELITGTADGTDTDPKLCLAFAKSGIGLALGQDIRTEMGKDPAFNFNTRVQAFLDVGAVRVEEEKVVAIECVQS